MYEGQSYSTSRTMPRQLESLKMQSESINHTMPRQLPSAAQMSSILILVGDLRRDRRIDQAQAGANNQSK